MFARTRLTASILMAIAVAPAALAKPQTVRIGPGAHDVAAMPACRVVPAPPAGYAPRVTVDGKRVEAQLLGPAQDGKVTVTWVMPPMKAGANATCNIDFAREPNRATPRVTATREGKDLVIKANGDLITRYDATTGPNKPYFYPLYGPGQKLMVRRYPLEKVAGETTDHPHHRGMWFTHGEVNGKDYWTEVGIKARTVNTRYEEVQSGPVCAAFRAHTDWIDADGARVAEDTRDVAVYDLPDARIIDLAIVLRPIGKALDLGDTKEGTFGIRVPDSMRQAGGDGHIVTSAGIRGAKAWGTRADWVDYYGTVDGATMGIAILDGPDSFRHPTYWHVRDYGLFAANPFGIHDFVKGQPAGAGKHELPVGQALTFRYRVVLHRGDTDAAGIAGLWDRWSGEVPPQSALLGTR